MLNAALGFAEKFDVFPVSVYRDELGAWKKHPLVPTLDEATRNPAVINRWWSRWPQALPGFRLPADLVIVDVDDPQDWPAIPSCLGPHSRVATPSGHYQLVFAQPSPPISTFRWSPGIEIIAGPRWAIGYDYDEWSFPRVAPRAVLPKVFWRAREMPAARKCTSLKTADASRDPVPVGDVTAALRKMDALDWNGDYYGWFALMTACCWAGISERDFVEWSISDPDYAADGRLIRRMWRRLEPQHGGALFAALAERGIRIGRAKGSVFNGVHVPAATATAKKWQPPVDIRPRINGILFWLERHTSEADLLSASCLVPEIIAEHGKPTPTTALGLLVGAAKENGLWKEIGAHEVRRTITNGLRFVEEKMLVH
jgi:Bifunctional DNA primase/polymerase, N-terminal